MAALASGQIAAIDGVFICAEWAPRGVWFAGCTGELTAFRGCSLPHAGLSRPEESNAASEMSQGSQVTLGACQFVQIEWQM